MATVSWVHVSVGQSTWSTTVGSTGSDLHKPQGKHGGVRHGYKHMCTGLSDAWL